LRFESRAIAVPVSPPDSTTKTPRHEIFPKIGWQVPSGATDFLSLRQDFVRNVASSGCGGTNPLDVPEFPDAAIIISHEQDLPKPNADRHPPGFSRK
jgi:hypothetical protein